MPRMARTRRSTLAAASRSDGRVARSSAPAPMLATSVTRKPPSGAAAWLVMGVAARAGAYRVSSSIRARARVVGGAPRADVPQQQLAVVDRGNQRTGERGLPVGRAAPEPVPHALDPRRHVGEGG